MTGVQTCALPISITQAANSEISRENPESLFVTAFCAILDLETGALEYCNAGHEPPYLLRSGEPPIRVSESGGPPLCVMEDFPYESATLQLKPGDMLVVMTDGVVEATNKTNVLYGRPRTEAVLAEAMSAGKAQVIGEALRANVAEFVAGADPADDIALLVVRWTGTT